MFEEGAALKALSVYITICIALGLTLSLMVTLPTPSQASGRDADGVARIIVVPGDTVWDLAVRHGGPGEDPRRVAYEIATLNDLQGYVIRPGQELLIPKGP